MELITTLKGAGPIESVYDEYNIENTSCGLPTLAKTNNNQKYYYHSNINALKEATLLAEEWYLSDKSTYIVYGLGLGYHVMELLKIDENVIIHVYESDSNIMRFAFTYSDLSKILASNRVFIHYDPTFNLLSARLKDMNKETCFVIHYPSMRGINEKIIRQQLEDFFVLYSSVKNQSINLDSNFRENRKYFDTSVDVLESEFVGKNLYIIAAGPSLDLNYKELKKVGTNAIILATGTVLKKLINYGIKPDYVIITDGNNAVYPQIEGIETIDVPLLHLSTVYHKIVKNYNGKKYFICQKDYNQSEELAHQNGYRLYNTGGSVSTTALDLGIRFQCERIVFVGMDLAYTNNLDHAKGTPSRNQVDLSDWRKVKDINGKFVNTGKNLDIYRKWMERRISGINDIEFIDATEGGARIEGTVVKKLSKCF